MDRDIEAGMLLEGDSMYGSPAGRYVDAEKFYIASSFDGLAQVKVLMATLRAMGHKIAFDWTTHLDHQCSEALCGVPSRRHLAHRELDAASGADMFIGIARMGKGTHVELGAYLGASYMRGVSPNVLLVGVWDGQGKSESVFYEHVDVKHVSDLDKAIEFLKALK